MASRGSNYPFRHVSFIYDLECWVSTAVSLKRSVQLGTSAYCTSRTASCTNTSLPDFLPVQGLLVELFHSGNILGHIRTPIYTRGGILLKYSYTMELKIPDGAVTQVRDFSPFIGNIDLEL